VSGGEVRHSYAIERELVADKDSFSGTKKWRENGRAARID
jgi:hypothetical protein